MSQPQILIAGIGNIFFGDDAFGVEVAQRLLRRSLPDKVKVVDFGIRGIDLTYALMDNYETVVLVDAAPRGGKPGTLYVIQPDPEQIESAQRARILLNMHNVNPEKVLQLAFSIGSKVRNVLLVGCEPVSECEDSMSMEMSEPVRAAVEEAVPLVESLIPQLLSNTRDSESKMPAESVSEFYFNENKEVPR